MEDTPKTVPWLAMLRSGQWWLLVVINIALGVAVLFCTSLLPIFTSDVHTNDPQMISIITAIISSPLLIFIVPFSVAIDYMQTKFSLSASRKSMLGFGSLTYVPAITAAGYLGSHITLVAVVILTLSSVSVTAITAGLYFIF